MYFHDDASYKKLWDFLQAKSYPVDNFENFLKRIKEPLSSAEVSVPYLEKIYSNCKDDGHFNKFDSYDIFCRYFKDLASYKKLWDFLKSIDYKVAEFEDFYFEITGEKLVLASAKQGLFDGVPLPAYGDLSIPSDDLRKFPDILRFGTISYKAIDIPLMIPLYGHRGFTLIVEDDNQKKTANRAIELMAFRILCSVPDGKCKFYIIDSEKNGQSFSNIFGFDPRILEREVWDDVTEIANGLQDIKNDIPIVQSEILTTKYKDLKEYNEQIQHSRKPFQFILIANFPGNFNSNSLDHLQSIMKNGSKSGIYVLMSYDITRRLPSFDHFNHDDFRRLSVEYDFSNNKLLNIEDSDLFNEQFYVSSICDTLPSNIDSLKNQLNQALDKIYQLKLDVIDKNEYWTKSSSRGITVPVGVSADNKLINLQFGDGKDVHHALIGGATGKGKTVLLHDIIINASKLYSPDELQFILMDYKEGTEFKVYSNLPHLKVLTISGEVEFGLSIFEYLTEEIKKRGALFKNADVTDFATYKATDQNRLPRLLVIMDEFQVLLDPKKRVSSRISAMLEDVTRRGRSFGINLILSTQSLGEVDISSSTLSQLGLRIAFSMPEYDCMKILHVDNVMPSEFTKAGQAVHNTAQGKKEGNTIFQAAFIEKSQLPEIIASLPSPKCINFSKAFIFDGTRDIKFEENETLWNNIRGNNLLINDLFADSFIGEPFYLSDKHVFIRLRKQQESNVLMIGDDPGGAISVANKTIYQVILQSQPESKVLLFDLFPVDSGWMGRFNFDEFAENNIHNTKIYSRSKLLDEILSQIRIELENRFEDDSIKTRILLCIMNTNSIKDLRSTGYDISPLAGKLLSIIKDGPEYGIHTILHFLNRKSFDDIFERSVYDEFENKILLKGQNPYDFGLNVEDVIENEYTGYAIHPKAKYESDKFKIYKP